MDKKIIEEVAKELCPHYDNGNCYYEANEVCECCCGCEFCWAVSQVLNAGYRKIPEGAVVLTREEYERRKGFSREEVDEIIETAINNSRKKTVDKFTELAKAKLNEWLEDNEDNDGKIDFGIAEIELIGVETLEGEVISESLIDEIAKEIKES